MAIETSSASNPVLELAKLAGTHLDFEKMEFRFGGCVCYAADPKQSVIIIDDKSLGLNDDTGRLLVRCVLEDSKGNLWIGNNGIGVILHDGQTATQFTQEKGLGKVDQRVGRTTPQPGDLTGGSPSLNRVFSIGEDPAGNIWFGTIEHGAWRYDGTSLRNFSANDGLTSKQILCIYTDRRGELWLAGNGVFKFNGTSFDRIH